MGIYQAILDLLFPPRCVFCRDFLRQKDAHFCPTCAENLPFCPDDAVCQTGDFYSACVTPFFYTDGVKDSVHRYKFQNAQGYRRAYGPILAACIDTHAQSPYDLITWAPLSRKRLRKRGYDQAKLLAEETARYLDKPCTAVLQKVRNVPPQSGAGGRAARKANIAGAYKALDPAQISGKRILLIDDVLTTGSTLSECARSLLLAGAEEISCAALARAPIWEVQDLEKEQEKVLQTV